MDNAAYDEGRRQASPEREVIKLGDYQENLIVRVNHNESDIRRRY